MYYNDVPILIPGVHCDSEYKCGWESFHNFLLEKTFKERSLLDFCFSHITPPETVTLVVFVEDVSLWCAICVGVPLAIITCIPVKIFINVKRKRELAKLKQERSGNLNGNELKHFST